MPRSTRRPSSAARARRGYAEKHGALKQQFTAHQRVLGFAQERRQKAFEAFEAACIAWDQHGLEVKAAEANETAIELLKRLHEADGGYQASQLILDLLGGVEIFGHVLVTVLGALK